MTKAIAEDKETKWIKTRVKHLYRHRDSGRYYVQGYRQGKEIWKTLKTKSAEVGRAQAPKALRDSGSLRRDSIQSESRRVLKWSGDGLFFVSLLGILKRW